MKDLRETISGMESEDYKERFMAEYDQVDIRLGKLKAMLEKYKAGTLPFTPDCPIELLARQAEVMTEYKEILVKRSGYESIDL